MRARHHDTAGPHACPRCVALLEPGQLVCGLCGFDPDRETPLARPVHSVRMAVVAHSAADHRADPGTVLVAERERPSGHLQPTVTTGQQPADVHLADQQAAAEEPAERRSYGAPARIITVLAVLLGCLAVVRVVLSERLPATVVGAVQAPDVSAALGVLQLAAVLAMTVVFLRWVARARAFVDAESTVPQRWSPRASQLGWLVPVAGVLLGWQVLQDLWTGSDPATRLDPAARRPEPVALTCWFGGLAVSSVVWLAGQVVLGGAPFVGVVSAVALAASGVCLAQVVTQISRWQTEGTHG